MEPFVAKKLPFTYKLDKELLRTLGEANEKYGQYKSLLKLFKFDSKLFLDSLILSESLQSSRIEGTQISQDDIYYMKYKEENDDFKEVTNLKAMFEYAERELKNSPINLKLINGMHKVLLSSGRGSDKSPGAIRTVQNYIGLKGLGKEGATFIPPIPEDVPELLQNLFDYMNDKYEDEVFINLAISHSQFETIHPYIDGNGRLGRALIPIQLSKFKDEEPILFLSEVIELYKPSYYKNLNESRDGNMEGFIKFFLRCVVDQCSINILRIEQMNKIYDEDYKIINEHIGGKSVYKIFPIMLQKKVFTIDDIAQATGLHNNSVINVLKKLTDMGIVLKEKKESRITYKYKRVYDVFANRP